MIKFGVKWTETGWYAVKKKTNKKPNQPTFLITQSSAGLYIYQQEVNKQRCETYSIFVEVYSDNRFVSAKIPPNLRLNKYHTGEVSGGNGYSPAKREISN